MNAAVRSLAAALVASGFALPATAASNNHVAKELLGRVIGTALVVAAPGVFVGLVVIGTGLMVKTIASTANRHPHHAGFNRRIEPERQERPALDAQSHASPFPLSGWYRPVSPHYQRASVDSSAFPTSTGLYGAVIRDGGE